MPASRHSDADVRDRRTNTSLEWFLSEDHPAINGVYAEGVYAEQEFRVITERDG
jgi:hypothetical protein